MTRDLQKPVKSCGAVETSNEESPGSGLEGCYLDVGTMFLKSLFWDPIPARVSNRASRKAG